MFKERMAAVMKLAVPELSLGNDTKTGQKNEEVKVLRADRWTQKAKVVQVIKSRQEVPCE